VAFLNRIAASFSVAANGAWPIPRVCLSGGKRDEARTMLADIYNWFTEGFDTAGLIDSKALLDELSE
jgi:hypothetical protein